MSAPDAKPGPDDESPEDLLYDAWVLIANAYGGRWDEDPQWKAAAIRWRDSWHETIRKPTAGDLAGHAVENANPDQPR